jgi:hypothetical protein
LLFGGRASGREGDFMKAPFSLNFSEIRMADVPRVGGKNASLGEPYAVMNGLSGSGVIEVGQGLLKL